MMQDEACKSFGEVNEVKLLPPRHTRVEKSPHKNKSRLRDNGFVGVGGTNE